MIYTSLCNTLRRPSQTHTASLGHRGVLMHLVSPPVATTKQKVHISRRRYCYVLQSIPFIGGKNKRV